MTTLIHDPAVQALVTKLAKAVLLGAVTGAVGAARADYMALKTWKSFHDAAEYQWGIAVFRWCQGAIVGAGAGLAAVSGLTGMGVL